MFVLTSVILIKMLNRPTVYWIRLVHCSKCIHSDCLHVSCRHRNDHHCDKYKIPNKTQQKMQLCQFLLVSVNTNSLHYQRISLLHNNQQQGITSNALL